jgi:organic hydroperoxide reductase OsmC/OhrA
MAVYTATVRWERGGQKFSDGKFSRGHVWEFDGGASIAASASPHLVRLPYSVAENVDPEEAFVASASSCHMLFFLFLAQKAGFVVENYRDDAEGIMGQNEEGRMAMTRIRLQPKVQYAGSAPDPAAEAALHHKAHEACFISNSVKTRIVTLLGD